MIEATNLHGGFMSPSQLEAEREQVRGLVGAAEVVVTRYVERKGLSARDAGVLRDMIFGGI